MALIDVSFSNGCYFIWNAEDVFRLRTEHRIVGSCTGCLPSQPRQDLMLGLPLELMSEEVSLLLKRGAVRVLHNREFDQPAPGAVKEEWERLQRASFKEQAGLFREERLAHVMKFAPKIIEGKRKKHGGNDFDEKAALQIEIDKIPPMSEDNMTVQLFTRSYWRTNPDAEMDPAIKPSTRAAVFADLWEKGYYLTGGQKFGGDFLVYPGDPLKFHSHYIAVCVEDHEPLMPKFLICKGRLGTNVKKTVLFCSVNDQGGINYQSLNWNGK